MILGYRFWQNRLGSDPDIVGKTLTLDGIPHVVVGIAPDQFDGHLGFTAENCLFRSNGIRAFSRTGTAAGIENFRADRAKEWLHIHGRLSPGVSVAQASAAVAAITARLAKAVSGDQRVQGRHRRGVRPTRHSRPFPTLASFRPSRYTLTGMVLLVVCLNISGMMQVRSAMRERELSIRQAIGASRARLAAISVVRSDRPGVRGRSARFAGALQPSVAAVLAHRATASGSDAGGTESRSLRWSRSVSGLCLLTSLVFGLLPALRFSRPVIISSLKDDAGVGRAPRGSRSSRDGRVAGRDRGALASS